CNPGNTPQTCRNRQKIGDLSALSAADAVASFSGRVDQTILKGLEDHVEDYFRRNPGITRPTLPPRLPTAGTPVDVDLPSHSVGPLFPVFFLKTPTVTRPGSDAGISDDVMQAALKMVKVHSQTSRSMENEKNVINTRVGNFLRAIWQNERVHMVVVIKAKENKDNAEKLVESLRQLVQSNPSLGLNY
ncbi:hypothetical protein, partial [Xanthomonas vasicola]|uniref:hypothetical protein n=1 Tax=Xanthomonas vasicola TaxID=56459 RepID=UPI002175F144